MLNPSKDLWSEVDFNIETQTPVGLLKEQANMLSIKTNGLLKGELTISTEYSIIYNTFSIIAPKLDSYRCALIKVVSGPAMYPAYVYDYSGVDYGEGILVKLSGTDRYDIPRASFVVSDYAQFESAVQKILSSKETTDIIRSLMSQSKALVSTSG